MKTIVHTCSSILLRPNGITRYINAVIDLQKSMGHRVIFVSDAKPTQLIHTDEIYFIDEESAYTPNWRDSHVWLQIDPTVSDTVLKVFKKFQIKPDLLISHDLHSFIGCQDITQDGIFIQHESDVLNDSRWSYLSDEYLTLQMQVVHETAWRTGLVVMSDNVSPKRPVYAPIPFVTVPNQVFNKPKQLLYIGDASERKGARDFMAVANTLGVKPTVITHEPDATVFAGADVHTFTLAERDKMFQLMSQHQVCYFSSKNECGPVAVLECLQFMPVIVNASNRWTKNIVDWGVEVVPEASIAATVTHLLEQQGTYDRSKFDLWAKNSRQFWANLSA